MNTLVIRRWNRLAAIAVAGILLSLALGVAGLAAPVQAPGLAAILNARVGPGATIGVRKDPDGKVLHLAPGRYEFRVSDRSRKDNFHLSGPTMNKRTSVVSSVAVTWKLRLVPGLYRYRSDAHPKSMRGSFKVG
jgi:hypothetical protein